MVVPYDVADSAQDAEVDRVIAWLDSGGDVNDVDQDGFTLINRVARGGTRSGRIGPKLPSPPSPVLSFFSTR